MLKRSKGIPVLYGKLLFFTKCSISFSLLFFTILSFTSCNQINVSSDSTHIDATLQNKTDTETESKARIDTVTKNDNSYEETEIVWNEITNSGVNEELLIQNIDTDILEYVGTELQTLVEEEIAEERENPEILLSQGWTRVFESSHYANVLSLGKQAMKPLYYIIYKSSNSGLYEYICAYALYELSGYDFTDKDGVLTWTNSKEFLDVFNNQIIN